MYDPYIIDQVRNQTPQPHSISVKFCKLPIKYRSTQMRPAPTVASVQSFEHMSPSELSSSSPISEGNYTHNSRLRNYSTSRSSEADLALVIILLLCALICALALNTAIRCFLRGYRIGFSSSEGTRNQQQQKTSRPEFDAADVVKAAATTMVFSAGKEAECAICLSEFVEGEEIQVLKLCKHSFHWECIQKWMCTKSSCPTCRCSLKSP